MKNILSIICLALLSFKGRAAFLPVYGSEVVISQTTNEDLYISGGTIRIDAPVHGDVVICGGTIIINDTVTGSIFMAGGDLSVNGYTRGHLRCGGGKIHINGSLGGDLVVAGGEITTNSKTVISGGILLAGGTVTINGLVKGRILANAGELTLNARAEDEVRSKSGTITINGIVRGAATLSANTLLIGNNAVFNDSIRYWTPDNKVDFKHAVFGAAPVYDPGIKIETKKWVYFGFASLMLVLWYLAAVLTVIVVIQLGFAKLMAAAGASAVAQPGRSLGKGVLFFLLVPIGAAILFISLVGIPLGIVVLVLFGVLLAFSLAITSVVASNWLNMRFKFNWGNGKLILFAFLLFIGFKFLSTVPPFIGWFAVLLVTAAAFGAILVNIKRGARVAS